MVVAATLSPLLGTPYSQLLERLETVRDEGRAEHHGTLGAPPGADVELGPVEGTLQLRAVQFTRRKREVLMRALILEGVQIALHIDDHHRLGPDTHSQQATLGAILEGGRPNPFRHGPASARSRE